MSNSNEVVVLEPYNPLDKKRIGEQIAAALLAQPIHPLPPEKFIGAGVYALYYTGDFPSYALLSTANKNGQYRLPIYVGKAVPDGTRKINFRRQKSQARKFLPVRKNVGGAFKTMFKDA